MNIATYYRVWFQGMRGKKSTLDINDSSEDLMDALVGKFQVALLQLIVSQLCLITYSTSVTPQSLGLLWRNTQKKSNV